ncbi:DNA polymerase I [Pelomonas sp. Root1444]|uniref:DNA polymerase I n=1 Tax=Pelomonas sp. Root1444 TaxID=1736464 RepID=UPI0007032F10|nr:DNA polymerase I [Pelomonas sp. Root1444]KQY88789.1 DNA polymerase I [Pelomonas sp. Root1444]
MSKPILLLVDGSSYLYRAFHAMPDLRGPEGQPTGAVRGMVAMLKKLQSDVGAEHAVCVFDASGPTFRDEWYPEYKAQRSPMPPELRAQIEPIHEVVKLLGWPTLTVPGVEADDVIGTLCCIGAKEGHRMIVSTGDKDLSQLVNADVELINTMSNERLDEAGVLAKFGVPPDRIVDYLTLMGDTVDNVPGVPGVGPKTAAKWIAEYGSLDGVMAAASAIKGKAGENLRATLDWLPTGRKLVTVKVDCELAEHVPGWPKLDDLAFREPDKALLGEFYVRNGFKQWLEELTGTAVVAKPKAPPAAHPGLFDEPEPPAGAADIERRYETILTFEQLEAWLVRLHAAPLVALDTETDSLDPMAARIVGISFADKPGEAAYIPLQHSGPDAPEQLPLAAVLARLKSWLEDDSAKKIGQNLKYDRHVLLNHGINLGGVQHDTLLQSYVLEAHKTHNLEALAERHLGRKGLSYEDLCGKGAHQIPFAQVSVDKATTYSGEDSEMCLHLHSALWPQIEADVGLTRIYRDIEMPTADLLARVERHGVLIDSEKLKLQSHEIGQRLVLLESQCYDIAGQPFNIGSPKQIGDILFGKLGLPVVKKTATGAPSTDEEVLTELAADFPLPAKILEYRGLSKLKSTYTDKLPLQINAHTGRVHTNYAQAVAVTGRLSSNEPNLQNIPIRTAEGRRVREAFVAPEGFRIVSADYSQIELRIMAHISEDPGLLRAFQEGQDVHRATASEVFGIALDEVSSEQRRYAKTINFGLIYGMGAFGLASALGIEQKAAKDYIERYFTRFAGVKRYMDETKARAAERGFVETLFGRRIYLPEIRGGNGQRRAGAERQAINAPMQGTAADLIKLAMLAVQAELDRAGKQAKIVMQVHDELVFEVPEAELDWMRAEVPRLMAGVAALKVPLLAEVGVGSNWEEAH